MSFTACCQSIPEPMTRSTSAAADRDGQDSADGRGESGRQRVRVRQHRQPDIERRADEQDVSDFPRPGRCRSGIHSTNTAAPIRLVIRPMDRWARDAMPCEKTVQEELPRLAATSIASPVPNGHRPNTSDAA